MVKKFCVIVVLVFCSFGQVFSQSDESKSKSLEVHIMPFSIIDFRPRVRIGLEYQPNSKVGYVMDIGYGNNLAKKMDMWYSHRYEDYSFFEIRPEFKYYFFRRKHFLSTYFAGELFYMKMHVKEVIDDDYSLNSSSRSNFDNPVKKKEKYGIHLKAGIKFTNRGLSFEVYGGVGGAYRVIEMHNIDDDYFLNNLFYGDEGSVMLHLALGVKVGVVLWK